MAVLTALHVGNGLDGPAAMDFDQIPLFAAVKKRLSWLGQRHQVLAQNIANADTPGQRPHDLEPLTFRGLLRRPPGTFALQRSDPGHLAGLRPTSGEYAVREDRRPFETAPAGNAVVLEEQMAKVNETSLGHSLATQLYRKHLGMIRSAATVRQ